LSSEENKTDSIENKPENTTDEIKPKSDEQSSDHGEITGTEKPKKETPPPKKDEKRITSAAQTYQVTCKACDLQLVSDESQEKADELLKIHLLDHKNDRVKDPKPDKNPSNLSFTVLLGIMFVSLAIGFGAMMLHGKKKISQDEKEKGK